MTSSIRDKFKSVSYFRILERLLNGDKRIISALQARGVVLQDGRLYGQYTTDQIEQTALELFHIGKLPKCVELAVEKRNPKTLMFRKQFAEDAKSKWTLANNDRPIIIKTAAKKQKRYDYEKIIKDVYEYTKRKDDLIPLRERRDYGEEGRDFLEQQALDLKEEGKLPKKLEKEFKKRRKN